MSLITVITAQAALYSSELLTAWGVTGATTIAIAQAVALTLLVVAAIIAVVAVVAAFYYCAQRVASAFKVIAAVDAPVVAADALAAVAINANWDMQQQARDIEFKKSLSSEYSCPANSINAGGLDKVVGMYSTLTWSTLHNCPKAYDPYLPRADPRIWPLTMSAATPLNEAREEDENKKEQKGLTP